MHVDNVNAIQTGTKTPRRDPICHWRLRGTRRCAGHARIWVTNGGTPCKGDQTKGGDPSWKVSEVAGLDIATRAS